VDLYSSTDTYVNATSKHLYTSARLLWLPTLVSFIDRLVFYFSSEKDDVYIDICIIFHYIEVHEIKDKTGLPNPNPIYRTHKVVENEHIHSLNHIILLLLVFKRNIISDCKPASLSQNIRRTVCKFLSVSFVPFKSTIQEILSFENMTPADMTHI